MSTSFTGPCETPADLTCVLKKVRAALEDRKYQSLNFQSLEVRDDSDTTQRDVGGSLDDVKEAFGACQTIEWKEQEYRYLRSKVIGHRRRDMVKGSSSRATLGGSALPAVHRMLLRSMSTPDAPQVETRSYKTFLRHRRASLALEGQPAGSCGCGVREGKPRRGARGLEKDKIPVESESDDLYEFPSEVCAKILSYVKSNAWASRESLLSAASRSLGSSEEDNTSVILNTSVDACKPKPQVKGGVPRSVSEETLLYNHENPVEERSGEASVPATSVVSQVPATSVVSQVPATSVVSQVPATSVVSQAPATSVVSQASATSVVSQASATSVVSQAAATSVVSQVPATSVVSQVPATSVVSQAPGTSVVSQAPGTSVVSQASATSVVSQTPATSVVSQEPTTSVVSQAPTTIEVSQVPATSEVSQASATSEVSQAPATSVVSQASATSEVSQAPTTSVASQAPAEASHSHPVTPASPTDDPGGTTPITASVASILDTIPHIDSSDDDDEGEDDPPGSAVVAADVLSSDHVARDIKHLPPELPPLCEPEDDLCEPEDDLCMSGDDLCMSGDDLCMSGDDWHEAQPQPAVVVDRTHNQHEDVYKGVGSGLYPSYARGHLSCHAHPDSPSHAYNMSSHAHIHSPGPAHIYSFCHAHNVLSEVSGYAHRKFSCQTQSQSANLSQSQSANLSHSQSANHSHSQSANLSHSQSANHSHSQSANHSHSQSANHSHSQSANHSHSQSASQSHSQSANQSHSQSANQSHSQSAKQPHSQSSKHSHRQSSSHAYSQVSSHAHSQLNNQTHSQLSNDTQSHARIEETTGRRIDEAAVAVTGGFSKDGWVIAEVLMGKSGEVGAWLAQCCDPAHPYALPRPSHTPLLLLLPAPALHTSPHLLHTLKERAWGPGVHVWVVTTSSPTAHHTRQLITNNSLQAELVSEEELQERVPRDHLTSQFGGTLQLDHHAWLTFCKIREGVLDLVRRSVSMLETCVSLSPAPSPSSPSPSSQNSVAPTSTTDVQEVRQYVHSAKSSLREMEKWCQRLHKHVLVRCWVDECKELVEMVDTVTCLLTQQESSRHCLLTQQESSRHCLLTQQESSRHWCLYQQANSVVAWLLGRGEETLARHQTLADTLTGVTRQEAEFLKFHSVAMRHLEKGGALLEEAAAAGETEASVRELARALHLHLTQFTDRLHHTRDRLEDTARCYHLLDKAYEWALEAMKVVGRVKGEGLASPEQVGAAGRTLTAYLEEHPPIPDDTFTAMTTLATRLNNHTLLQQCKMAQVRCQETCELLRNRQAALYKAKRQMEFDCQSFVDLGEVFGGGGEEMSPLAWLACSPLNVSGRRRSVSSLGSRPRDALSRCPSLDTDDDSVFLDPPPPPPPAKTPLEPRTSLGGIKEVRESAEDLEQPSAPSNNKLMSPSGITTSSSGSSGTCGSSSCSSSESSGPVSINKQFMKRANTWQYGLIPKEHNDENSGMDDGVPLSPTSHKSIPPSSAVNSHLLIRGSQLNLSINTDDLSQEEVKKSKTVLLIMRELIQTERDYVNSLEYIIENYIPELMREDIPQALRGQRNVVFGNIEKIYEFHSGYFLRALEACEMRPFAVGSIFLRYESQFYLYALYNKNKPKSDSLMSEYGSAFFRKKQLELEDRMDLASYLLKPVQRMGKYALILKQLLKECGRGEENYDDILGAQEMVQFQLRHGNDLLAMDSLRDCDVNLKEQGRLLRQGEFVVWEGSRAKKSVRHVFLFEDLILFSKARRDPEKKALDIFQYKHSMKMTDIGLTEQVSVSTTKFEIWFRKRKPSDTYLFQAPNAEMKEAWTEEISKLLWRQALRNRTMRLHEMSSMGIGNKPCLDIRPSEDQISDRSISINQLNKAPRLRTGSTSTISDLNGGVGKRPHSIISVSSSSASSSASSASSSHSSTVCPTYVGALNLGFEAGDSPRALHRSVTRTSQCSAESGILADMYSGGDDDAQSHRRVERSNSTVTTVSVDSALSPVSSCSPVSPVAPTLPSLIMVSPTRPTDVIYEAPSVTPTVKDSSAKTLLTTEHHGESAPPYETNHSSISTTS